MDRAAMEVRCSRRVRLDGPSTSASIMMTADTVLAVLATLEQASVKVWLDGGWGVDALLCQQTREHGDLDLIVSSLDVHTLREALRARGFELKDGGTATGFVLADERGQEVDVHAIE